jgi:hypothetical protein
MGDKPRFLSAKVSAKVLTIVLTNELLLSLPS